MAPKKEASADDIMAPAEMKAILARAKRGDDASAVIGLTKDKDGVILLDKKKKPKQLVAILKKQAAEAGLVLEMPSLRFGTASVDTDVDSGLVTFTVNKEASGAMRPKLIALLKKAGFSKLEIVVDAGLENEADEAEADADPDAAQAQAAQPAAEDPAAAQAAQPADAGTQDAASPGAAASGDAAAPTPEAAQAQGADMGQYTQQLAALIKQIPAIIGQAPAMKDVLVPLATAATAAVKSSDPQAAAGAIQQLTQALQSAQGGAPGAAPGDAANQNGAAAPGGVTPAALATIEKSRKAWTATRSAIEKQLDTLHDKMADAYKDHGFGPDLEKFFKAKVEPVLGTLDESLLDVLGEIESAGTPAEQKKLMSKAQQIIVKYEGYLSGEKLIQQLDDNPFMPLQIESTLSKTLAALSKTLDGVANSIHA